MMEYSIGKELDESGRARIPIGVNHISDNKVEKPTKTYALPHYRSNIHYCLMFIINSCFQNKLLAFRNLNYQNYSSKTNNMYQSQNNSLL